MFKRLTIAGLLFGSLAAAPPSQKRGKTVACGKPWWPNCKTAIQRKPCGRCGLQGNKNVQTMVEVWASEKTGTFTMLLTSAEGVSCVVAVGTNFFTQPPVELAEGLKG